MMPKAPEAQRIINRCQDTELDLSDFPGGALDSHARQLSDASLDVLIEELDYLGRGEPDHVLRRRYERAQSFLDRVRDSRRIEKSLQKIRDLAKIARSTGSETCECGQSHPAGSNYYVTVVDGGKTRALSGPYRTHAEAAAMVDEVKDLAVRLDPAAHFASFGTTAMRSSYKKRGILDKMLRPGGR
jgi:hypothetical protein